MSLAQNELIVLKFHHFIEAQNPVIGIVLDELQAGQKRTHWMWFVFPQHVGLGRSGMARRFGLGSIEEVQEYLADPILGGRLAACTEAVLFHRAKSALAIFGTPDDLKFRSCMTLFAIAVPQQSIFKLALNTFFAGERDPLTVALLA
jgi:uncharacterized protein (DUF1810 family)